MVHAPRDAKPFFSSSWRLLCSLARTAVASTAVATNVGEVSCWTASRKNIISNFHTIDRKFDFVPFSWQARLVTISDQQRACVSSFLNGNTLLPTNYNDTQIFPTTSAAMSF